MARLSNFILKNLEPIMLEWEMFAATLVPEAQRMDHVLLRDHGEKMLKAIALDLSKPESEKQKVDKSKGEAAGRSDETAAKVHGADRLALGFTLDSAVAEYRALRATVIRLWQDEIKRVPSTKLAFEDMIRFNEAIDQAITESVTSYSAEKTQQSRVFNAILSNSPDLSFTFDRAGKLTFGNRALLEFLNLSLKEVLGKRWTNLVADGGAELERQVKSVIKLREETHAEIELKNQDGRAVTFDCILVPVLTVDQTIEVVAGTMRDITSRIVVEKINWQKANFDELTGLPNRSLFLDRLQQAVLLSGRVGVVTALLFIDLDRFKEVNDSFGHNVGDLLLEFAADRIRACVRESDTVARLGGDEFTVILHAVPDAAHIRTVAEKICLALATPFRIHESAVQVSASIGVSSSPKDAKTSQSLMHNADMAMYAAKSAGRGQVLFFAPELLALTSRPCDIPSSLIA
jgi:diguanylate cyclase (GGDEF)-like protein/PAS domain S-box-containing protein